MTFAIQAEPRTVKGSRTRAAGALPAVVYGGEARPESLALNRKEFLKLYKEAGEASLIDLVRNGAAAGKVLVQEVQYDPVSDAIIHVDLRRIDLTREMTATVQLRFIGEAPVIKEQGGTIVTPLHAVQVKCLPADLVSHLDVDLGRLSAYDIVIKIKDLALPAGITIVSPHAEDVVVKAARALTEEEIKKLEEEATKAADLSKIEVAGKKKEEEEAAAEGAAAGPAAGAAAGAAPAKPEAAEQAGKKEEKKEEKKK
ncbi:MAG: 50S ribosomal protein L25 [Candidatus Magasanikbacteria bacterium]|nr:50S ribosomal protein L25 [Candidatus Magasanikbacteria bacterium]